MPVGPTMESGAESLDDDLNAIRSQIRRLAGTPNWYDLPAPAGAGWIYITDVSVTGGTVTDKVWQDDPANTVLQSCTTSSTTLNVVLRASYPLVDVGGVAAELTRAADTGHYSGTVTVTVPGSGDLEALVFTPDGDNGASDTVAITVDAPPTVTALQFTGGYPGAQTELKAGDTFQLQVTADKNFDRVEVLDYEAGTSQVITVASGLSATVTITIANRGTSAVARPARVRVRDSVTLAYGPTRDTDQDGGTTDGVHLVTLNNLYPSGAISSITYPVSQSALKGTESATVNHTASNYDTIAYSDPTSPDQISIANPSTFEAAKSVTATGLAIFNNSSPNFRYTMTRNANAAVTQVQGTVVIAGIAPTIAITLPAARLRSGGNNGTAPQDHTVTITSNQPLAAAPTLLADSGGARGTFMGAWAGGPSVWTRALRVDETIPDEKGTFSFSGLVATGLAGLVQNTIGSGAAYVLGGFVSRTLTVTPFADGADIDTTVVDFSKLTAVEIPELGLAMVKQPIGTAVQADNPSTESKRGWYTIDATGIDPARLLLLHQGTIDGNAAGMTITGVQETV